MITPSTSKIQRKLESKFCSLISEASLTFSSYLHSKCCNFLSKLNSRLSRYTKLVFKDSMELEVVINWMQATRDGNDVNFNQWEHRIFCLSQSKVLKSKSGRSRVLYRCRSACWYKPPWSWCRSLNSLGTLWPWRTSQLLTLLLSTTWQ